LRRRLFLEWCAIVALTATLVTAAVLTPAYSAELRKVARTRLQTLHDLVDERRLEARRERQQQQQLRLAIEPSLAHEAAISIDGRREWGLRQRLDAAVPGIVAERLAQPQCEGLFEHREGVLQGMRVRQRFDHTCNG
jgi:hypothetical protein